MLLSCSNQKDKSGQDKEDAVLESKFKINSVYRIKRDHTYVDLNTGKKLSLRNDTISQKIIDEATGFPVPFIIDVTEQDTIDASGRIVNNAILPGKDGNWYVDEGKLQKIKQAASAGK